MSAPSRYTKRQKVDAVTGLVLLGTMRGAAEYSQVPQELISKWKKTAWWRDLEVNAKRVANESLDNLLTSSVHRALDGLIDRLEYGNLTHEGKRVPLPAKELANIAGILYDKRSMLRGDSVMLTQTSTVDFTDLKNQFIKFAKDMKDDKVIAVQ